MSGFLFACAGLFLFSSLFYLFPRKQPEAGDDGESEANLQWYKLRQSELLVEGVEELQGDVELRFLEDDAQAAAPLAVNEGSSFPRWVLLPLTGIAAAVLYYQLGAAPDVLINKQLQALSDDSSPQQMEVLLQAIEVRAAQRPDNQHYTALLGRYYMEQQDYEKAASVYGDLAADAPGDSQALAYAAQAEYLAGGRSLGAKAKRYAEQALAIDPHQRTALGLLGMAAFEGQQYRVAIDYWQRLLAMEPQDSESAQMISAVIERAREQLVASGESVDLPPVSQPQAVVETAGVTVRVSLPDGAEVSPGDTVFVLARGADSDSRMPVAVQRLQAAQLPLTLRLDDSKSMAGQKLSEMASIVVVVQVSPDGRPGEASATWLGQAGPLAPSMSTEPLEIQLNPAGS
ncbi:MAG: cytochrome C biogenesis protein [Halioglobus sp.]